ncbi:MAG: TonB-dependent receptor [Deltaproteobacteria bacterium]|nr:TonB-dependent receptor [Candidatus Anaeroferrophillacea bacterium]
MNLRPIMHHRNVIFALTALILLSAAVVGSAAAGETAGGTDRPVTLAPMTVRQSLATPTCQEGDLLYTGTEVTADGIALAGSGAASSAFATLDILPGIDVELQDPFGIAAKSVRIRGIDSMFTGMSIEGLPNYGIMPIGPRDFLYDMENMESIGLYKGTAPPGLGTGSGNRGGTVALQWRRPAEKFSADLRQSYGSFDARRSFLRLDTGRLPTGTAAFISASYSELDKWKGAGDLGPREHLTAGLSQPLGERFKIEMFYNYNDMERHDFMPLTYAQADDIKHNDGRDYNEHRTGDPTADVNYYDYHRGDYETTEFMTVASFTAAPGHVITIKPYYTEEDSSLLDGKADKVIDLERLGAVGEYRGDIGGCAVSAGYWYEAHDLKKYVRANNITAAGRTYAGWKYLTDNHGDGDIHSPWLQVGRRFGDFSIQAGLKYFSYTEPASTAYKGSASGGTPASYEDALDNNLGEDAALSLDETDFDEWLPSLALGWQLTPKLELYANYGRTYMRPYAYVPVATIYATNRAAFTAAGLTLQDVFDEWEMETADNFDIGCRWHGEHFDLIPTIFYAEHHDLLVQAIDPEVGVNYHQNLGDATAWGAELELNLYPSENIVVFFNPSYTKLEFDDDFSRGGTVLHVEGKQFPDTPKMLVKAGMIWTIGSLEVAPTVKYVGRRYGDPENTQSISGHATADLGLTYTLPRFAWCEELAIGLDITNLFDTKYVGAITASDDGTGTSYYAGTPFSAIASISAKF